MYPYLTYLAKQREALLFVQHKLTGEQRLSLFLQNIVGSGNQFDPNHLKVYASCFGLKKNSISAALTNLKKAGVVNTTTPGHKNVRIKLTWYVV